jgi:hypothetical protein
MSSDENITNVADGEYVFRRIPVSMPWYDPAKNYLSPVAFNPTKFDTTGLSLTREKLRTIEEAARGKSKSGYYVATLRVGDLRRYGMEVVSKPLDDNPGHAEIPELNYQNKDTDQSKEWKVLLALQLTLRVDGPFISP